MCKVMVGARKHGKLYKWRILPSYSMLSRWAKSSITRRSPSAMDTERITWREAASSPACLFAVHVLDKGAVRVRRSFNPKTYGGLKEGIL